jgi:hypothetical protein
MWPGVPAIIVFCCKEKQCYLLIFYPCFGRSHDTSSSDAIFLLNRLPVPALQLRC